MRRGLPLCPRISSSLAAFELRNICSEIMTKKAKSNTNFSRPFSKLAAYQRKITPQSPLATRNKFEILAQSKTKEEENGKAVNNSFETFVQLHTKRIKEISGIQSQSQKDGWQTVRKRKSRTSTRQKLEVRKRKTSIQQSFNYQSKNAANLKPNPRSRPKENTVQMELLKQPRWISAVNAIPLGKWSGNPPTNPKVPMKQPMEGKKQPTINESRKSLYIPPHRKTEQQMDRGRNKPDLNQNANDKQTNGEEIIISNPYNERRWKDCEDKGIYVYWNGPPRKRSRLVRKISMIWDGKVSTLNPFADKFWFILCRTKQNKEEIMRFDTLFYKGHHIKLFKWQPNFHKNLIGNLETIKWMECKEIPSELMEEITINKICNSIGNVIGFEDNPNKVSRIRVLVKSEHNQVINRKIITNRSIYKLKFEEYTGEIQKIVDANLIKLQITNNIKDLIKSKRDAGKTTKREEMDIAIKLTAQKEEICGITNEEIGDKYKEAEIEEQISYQHSLNKIKNCMDCQKEEEFIKEMELNIIKVNQLQHEILLIQNDLVDQSLLAEQSHKEHKGKEILVTESVDKLETSAKKVQVKNLEEQLIHTESIKHNLKNQKSENREEQNLETMQESVKPISDIGNEVDIPPADSAQWSNITIRKKGKKKSYKFWKTPSNGKDMFASDKEDNGSVCKANPSSKDINLRLGYEKQNTPTNPESNKGNELETEEDQQISKLLITEIIAEEQQEGEVSSIVEKILDEQNLDKLGIAMNQEGLITPICGKTKQKRGRKSLKELREAAGQVKDQIKIVDILNNGKGKCLPKEQ